MKKITMKTRIATGVAAASLLAVGATGIAASAQAASGSDQSTTQQAPRGLRDHGGPGMPGPGGPGARADRGLPVHGEMVVKAADGSFVSHVDVNGAVTAVSASSITVKAADGYTATFTVTSTTEVRTAAKPGTIADVKVGDTVHVDGTRSGSTLTADGVHVGIPSASAAKAAN